MTGAIISVGAFSVYAITSLAIHPEIIGGTVGTICAGPRLSAFAAVALLLVDALALVTDRFVLAFVDVDAGFFTVVEFETLRTCADHDVV